MAKIKSIAEILADMPAERQTKIVERAKEIITEIEKRPGADWTVYWMDIDGSRHTMSVYGAADAGEAFREAERSFSFDDGNDVEIVAVVRQGVDLSEYKD